MTLRTRWTTTAVLSTTTALAAAALVALPSAQASDLTCRTSVAEADPQFGEAGTTVSPPSVSTRVIRHDRTSAKVRKLSRNTWRADVKVAAKVRGSAVREITVRVPASVTATVTAECGEGTATETATVAVTGHGKSLVNASDVRKRAARGSARAGVADAARTRARHDALKRVQRKSRAVVRDRASTGRVVDDQTAVAAYRARLEAQAAAVVAARAEALAKAERSARSRDRRPTPKPSTSTSSSASASASPSVTSTPTQPSLTPTPTQPSVSATPTQPSVTPKPTQPSVSATPTQPSVTPTPTTPSSTPTSTPTSTPPTTPPTTPPGETKPLMIKHGWDMPRPAFVKSNVATMEQLPFDGFTVALPSNLSSKVHTQTPVTYEQFRTALAPMASTKFTTLRHNFVMAYSSPAGDLFSDWSVPISNYANLARAANEAGLEGVFFDIEEYFGAALRFPANCGNGKTLAQCQAQSQLRGQQIMDAMRAQWADVKVLSAFGAWISADETAKNLPGIAYNDIAWANRLSGPFVIGMIDSIDGTEAEFIDGGEIYTARSKAQFTTVKNWLDTGMPAKSPLVPAHLKGTWSAEVSSGFGIYDEPWIGVGMDVNLWQTTVANALDTTDEYVWAYTEKYDWWGTGWPATKVPTSWVDATRAARG